MLEFQSIKIFLLKDIFPLYIPIVTLSTEDNVKLTKQLNEGFKRPVYWSECQEKIEPKDLDNKNPMRI